ncbi:hypothetical protein BleG1_0107 [Shouchella lehensis G1]|uniref:Uncharacterized protein n=1 Tax=Shouchella lehensis G1 TaxID=1246626 RepID=A0A060LRD2_9BACI|nr:hypothetical protein BleG1_0107 [Shouchella lehensis G1]
MSTKRKALIIFAVGLSFGILGYQLFMNVLLPKMM